MGHGRSPQILCHVAGRPAPGRPVSRAPKDVVITQALTGACRADAAPPESTPSRWEDEEDRIRAAYARRTNDAGQYSWARMGHVFQAQERERFVLLGLRRHGMLPLADKSILEVGSGTGGRLRDFVKWGAMPENLTGVELLPGEIARARALLPAAVTLLCRNAAELPFPAATFDIVLQSTMFTSILEPALRRQVAAEMVRVLKPTGLILWSDFFLNNPRNHDVRRVSKREIKALFSGCRVELRRTGLAPPLARRLAEHSWLATYLLGHVPWLCTHYLGVIRPPGDRPGHEAPH